MKKILLSLAFAGLLTLNAQAQTDYNFYAHATPKSMEAFRHLGIGVEVGTTGIGVDLSMPIVTNHLVLRAGYNFLPEVVPSMDFDFSASAVNNALRDVNRNLNEVNQNIDGYNAVMGTTLAHVQPLSVNSFNDEITASVDPKLGFNQARILLEYYPSTFHTFHFTAGVYIGPKEFLELTGSIDQDSWSKYQTLYRELPNRSDEIDARLRAMNMTERHTVSADDLLLTYGYDGKTYYIDPTAPVGQVKANIEVMNVKPYFGIGFGRSVPQKRVGFQFEIGAWYHGEPKLVAGSGNPEYQGTAQFDANEDVDDVMDIVKKVKFYPQVAFRLTGRLF